MNSNSTPMPQNQPEFTDKALNAKFSYSFSRKQLIVLVNALAPLEFAVGDMRGKVLREMLEEIQRTAISSIGPNDYKDPGTAPIPKRSDVDVKTN